MPAPWHYKLPPGSTTQKFQNILAFRCRLRNRDGWSSVWGRLFWTRSVMGRLWDDHFRHLGHPPKFYRVQDAGFIDNSSSWWEILIISKKNHWKISKNHVFSLKLHETKKKQPPAGKLATEVRSGDAPKPSFSMKTYEKIETNPEIRVRSTIEIGPYFWICNMLQGLVDATKFLRFRVYSHHGRDGIE